MPNRAELLRPAELAEQLGVSRDTVYRRVESGEWPAVRLGSGPRAHIRLDPAEIAERLVGASRLIPLEQVAVRVGRSLEWCLGRVGELPCVETPYGPAVPAEDLRAWHRAAAGEVETR